MLHSGGVLFFYGTIDPSIPRDRLWWWLEWSDLFAFAGWLALCFARRIEGKQWANVSRWLSGGLQKV